MGARFSATFVEKNCYLTLINNELIGKKKHF